MSIDDDLQKAVQSLSKMKPGKPLERFIAHIRFPRFKNLNPGARIDFGFPVTALVGANGCGKTSVIHALYGAPERSSTSDYWFATSVDRIESRENDPQRFVYGHWLKDSTWLPAGGIVETRKARVKKANDPEYWEPTKVTSGDGMAPMPDAGTNPEFGGTKERVRSLDRWSAVKRDVLYLNFRSELGAFDQFFWFGQLRRGATHTKQDEIRAKSSLLKKALDEDLQTLSWHSRERVFKSQKLSKDDLEAASEILGKHYASARMVEHDLYGGQRARTVVFTTEDVAYSEAFAGSGEMAVVSLVVQIRAQKKETLILLDEPEVSLHPAAQKRLLYFLLEECRKKHHQIVFTTHSPHLVEHLPPSAIKVFTADAVGHFDVLNEVHSYSAFHRLGATPPQRIKVLVEDRLAKHVVDLASNLLAPDERSTFDIDFLPGGADTYFTHRIPTLMREKNVWVLLDGDQRRADSKGSSEIADNKVDEMIVALAGERKIVFGADGGADKESPKRLMEEKRKYIDYVHERLRFLPRSCPEEIVLKAVDATASPASSRDAKRLLQERLSKLGLTPSSSDSDAQAQLLLAQNSNGNDDLKAIAAILKNMLTSMSAGATK
ncbi:MAG: ATP-binding protein [Polyangiaceae bacterium]